MATDCCIDRASARARGMFNDIADESWFICDCQKKTMKEIKLSPMVKNIIEFLIALVVFMVINIIMDKGDDTQFATSLSIYCLFMTIVHGRKIRYLDKKVDDNAKS